MEDRPEGTRDDTTPMIPLFDYVDEWELDDALVMHRKEDGSLEFENDPGRFAAAPEALVADRHITTVVTIANRTYLVDGCTRDGNLVLRRVRS